MRKNHEEKVIEKLVEKKELESFVTSLCSVKYR